MVAAVRGGLADMVFGYIFAELMHSLRQELLDDGIVQSTSWPQTFDIRQCLLSGRSPMEIPDFLDVIGQTTLRWLSLTPQPNQCGEKRKPWPLSSLIGVVGMGSVPTRRKGRRKLWYTYVAREVSRSKKQFFMWRHHPYPWCLNFSLTAVLQWLHNTST